MITIELVPTHPARLRAPMGAWAGVREQKQTPSVVITGGFKTDYNSTDVSAQGHRYRQ